MTSHFPAAPWSTALKVASGLAGAVMVGVSVGLLGAVPVLPGRGHHGGFAVVLLLPATLLVSLLFMVTGYDVEGTELRVRRLLWSSRIPLEGLARVWAEPAACKGSLRLFGNGGLFSFSGLFYNRRLGRYRLFATDFSRAVVLVLPKRTVVVTPASPEDFVEHLHQRFPNAVVGPQDGVA